MLRKGRRATPAIALAALLVSPAASAAEPHRPTADLVPRTATGPWLVGIGGAMVAAGTAMGAVGLGVERCDEPGCADRRMGLGYGGFATVAVGAGLVMGIGLGIWRSELPEPPQLIPTRRAHPGMRGAGIALLTLGATGLFGGLFLSTGFAACDGSTTPRCQYGVAHPLGPALFAVGSAAFGLGLPLTVLGSHRKADQALSVNVRGQSASLVYRW